MTLWDALIERRDQQRQEIEEAPLVVSFDELPWENNPQGRMRWYLHPAKKPQAINSIVVYAQEIPAGSRSGKIHHQGGRVFFVWKGRGYSVVDGVRHDWEAEDLINLPINPEGVTYQHFNLDPEEPALLLSVHNNFDESLGVDMGAGLEQIEDAPDAPSR